jgi:hypothetical protein
MSINPVALYGRNRTEDSGGRSDIYGRNDVAVPLETATPKTFRLPLPLSCNIYSWHILKDSMH